MPPGPRQQGYDGMANLAHAVRRSMALYVAMNMTEPAEGMEGLFRNADRCAEWINPHAAEPQPEGEDDTGGALGQPWREVAGGAQ